MINKLKSEMQSLEEQVLPGMTKDEMYDLLVIAYFKAKDIIALLEASAPVVNVAAETIALKDLEIQDIKEAYNLASTQVDIYKAEAVDNTTHIAALKIQIDAVRAALTLKD